MRVFSFLAALTALASAWLHPCGSTPIRPTCGPVLRGPDKIVERIGVEHHLISFHAANAPAGSMGVPAFGTKQAQIQAPGTRVKGKLRGIVFGQPGFASRGLLMTSNA